MLQKIDHIGIVVKDVDEALKNYSGMFGFEVVERMGGPGGEFKAVLVKVGGITLEFLQPLTSSGSYARFLESRGGGLHHVSFGTSNIKQELKTLKSQGSKVINEEPISLPNGDKVVFVHPSTAENVLIELVQRASSGYKIPNVKMDIKPKD
jgi:methylmalonyl-CoA/ethylmalonyl-CoA epimerase